jgi:hypothetical protein
VFVHQCRSGGIFKAFPLHHVTPVAGRVADGYQDGFVFFTCSRQSLWTPRIPIHGIMGMLQQVRTLGMKESVGGHGKFRVEVADLVFQSGFYVLDFFRKIKLSLHFFEFTEQIMEKLAVCFRIWIEGTVGQFELYFLNFGYFLLGFWAETKLLPLFPDVVLRFF